MRKCSATVSSGRTLGLGREGNKKHRTHLVGELVIQLALLETVA